MNIHCLLPEDCPLSMPFLKNEFWTEYVLDSCVTVEEQHLSTDEIDRVEVNLASV